LKSTIASAVRAVSGVLPYPLPEALVVGLDSPGSKMVRIRILWSTKAPRQHQMLYSYDTVLSAIATALVDFEGRFKESRAA